ncbi:MAG: ATP-binding protein [Pseudomonadota bacterium]
MTLRMQLAAIAALALALPWAGCQYVRQTELGLRESQQQFVALTAANAAATFADYAFAPSARVTPTPATLVLAPLRRSPSLDGYGDDWVPAQAPTPIAFGADTVRLLTAEFGDRALVYVECPTSATELSLVAIDANAVRRVLRVDLTTRGSSAPALLPTHSGAIPTNAVVEPSAGRVHTEIMLPVAVAIAGLGVRVNAGDGTQIAASFTGPSPPAPVRRDARLEERLAEFVATGIRLDVIAPTGWVLGTVGATDPGVDAEDSNALLPERLIRWILAEPPTAPGIDIGLTKASGVWLQRALNGERLAERYVLDDGINAEIVAAAPIDNGGVVVARRPAAAQLLPGNVVLQRLALLTLGLTLGTVALLTGYATWLSYRIRQLSQAADMAIDTRGELHTTMPGNRAGDEIGDLSRSVEALLQRVREHNDYLKALAGRLSHELATPLSVVSSSLDNMELAGANERADYAARARDGIDRLRRVLAAMREANRTEEIVANATFAATDLAELLHGVTSGYESAYPSHRFDCNTDEFDSLVTVAPTLIVQLIDKLVDNAVSFAPPESTICLHLERRGATATITVENDGPQLDAHQLASIFTSLVSYRPEGSGEHLGFGLHIAQLIATGHGGRLTAANHAQGVSVTIALPL